MTIALLFLSGLVALFFGAEWLVKGSSSLAIRAGLTPLLVGLTVVAYGTSSPELIVSVTAALQNEGPIAIGNAVGSNILNIGIILGLTALFCPMRVQFQLIKIDIPVMIATALIFLGFFADGRIVFLEGLFFVAMLVAYTIVNIRLARRYATSAVEKEYAEATQHTRALWLDFVFIVIGLATLILGSKLLVSGSVQLARMWGVSEAVIGLTIVAAGTSMPELATSIMAAIRGQADIAIGNIVGSNICNILAILGVSGLLAPPVEGTGVNVTEIYIMIGFSVSLFVIAWTDAKIRRWEGAVLLVGYAVYLWHLWPK
jgi:cation:H+ antiporter